MLLDTTPQAALEQQTTAENDLLDFAQGPRNGDDESAGDELLRVFAAASEGFTAALAQYKADAAGAAWLRSRRYTFAHGWEHRADHQAGTRGHRLVLAWRDARDGLWRCAEPEQSEELRRFLRQLDHELARYTAHDAREAGHDELAGWLDGRAQGAMH